MSVAVMSSTRKSFSTRLFLLLCLLIFLVGGFVFLTTTLNQGVAPAIVVNPSNNAFRSVAAAPVQAGTGDQLLVWTAPAAGPGQHTASAPGQLAFMDGTGASEPITDVPQGAWWVKACGDTPTSPDGQIFAFFMGGDSGKLYVMKGASSPTPLADVSALACTGGGTFRYSPNSARMAYIAYEPGAQQSEFADGFLKVYNTADWAEQYTYENVTAFDMNNDSVAFVSFFTNDKNEADEAAVIVWNGNAELEVATLNPTAEDCKFTSASIAILPDSKLLLVMGHRCTSGDTRTSWQLYSVDPSSRSATLAASDFQTGQFASFARTNSIYLSPDGARAYITIPDGVTANTVGIKTVSLADLSLTDSLDRLAVMPTYSGGKNAFPRRSPDGRWLAFVVTSPSDENEVQIWNLADPSVPPIVVEAGSSGDTISAMEFTRDSSRLIVVAGGSDSANNSLIGVELSTASDFRIARGRFGAGLAVSPDNSEVALIDWQVVEDPKEPPYANTVIVNIGSSEMATVFTGAEIVDGKVTNQNFVSPLTWVKR